MIHLEVSKILRQFLLMILEILLVLQIESVNGKRISSINIKIKYQKGIKCPVINFFWILYLFSVYLFIIIFFMFRNKSWKECS
jgi:hypothetical protein